MSSINHSPRGSLIKLESSNGKQSVSVKKIFGNIHQKRKSKLESFK